MRCSCCEGWPVEEDIGFATFAELNLPPEGIDLAPLSQDPFLLCWKVHRHGRDCGGAASTRVFEECSRSEIKVAEE